MHEREHSISETVAAERVKYNFEQGYIRAFEKQRSEEEKSPSLSQPKNIRLEFPWAHSMIQGEIMLQTYEESALPGQTLEMWVEEEWLAEFSEEFNEALDEMLVKYPSELLKSFREDFNGKVAETRRLMASVVRIEKKIKSDMRLEHDAARKFALPRIRHFISDHKTMLDDLSNHEDTIVRAIEEETELERAA